MKAPIVAACIYVFMSFTPARAQPCEAVGCAKPPGTHFIAELHGGSSTYGGGGLAIGGVVGMGGKLRGFPPVFYLFGELAYNAAARNGSIPSKAFAFRDDRSFRDFVGGVRVYLPIFGPVRLFGEGGIGTTHMSANLELPGEQRNSDAWLRVYQLGGGAQVRLFAYLSLGLRFKAIFADDRKVNLAELTGDPLDIRTMATASVTWHF